MPSSKSVASGWRSGPRRPRWPGLRRGEQARLATTLVVREDSLTLFGFGSDAAKELFELVQSVSGVGPKIALALLAVLDPDQLRGALAAGDTSTLMRAPGIGKKGAERLVLELKDKVGKMAATSPTGQLVRRARAALAGQAHRRAGRSRLHHQAGR